MDWLQQLVRKPTTTPVSRASFGLATAAGQETNNNTSLQSKLWTGYSSWTGNQQQHQSPEQALDWLQQLERKPTTTPVSRASFGLATAAGKETNNNTSLQSKLWTGYSSWKGNQQQHQSPEQALDWLQQLERKPTTTPVSRASFGLATAAGKETNNNTSLQSKLWIGYRSWKGNQQQHHSPEQALDWLQQLERKPTTTPVSRASFGLATAAGKETNNTSLQSKLWIGYSSWKGNQQQHQSPEQALDWLQQLERKPTTTPVSRASFGLATAAGKETNNNTSLQSKLWTGYSSWKGNQQQHQSPEQLISSYSIPLCCLVIMTSGELWLGSLKISYY